MLRVILFLITNLAIVFVIGLVLQITGIGPRLAGGNMGGLLVMCAIFGFAGSLISLFMSKWMAKRSMGVQLIEQPRTADERWLYDTVAELSQKAGIGMPEVGIFPSHQSNAFATGWNRDQALVAVSEGLLHRFNRDEVRAVLGHEIGHVANGDMITLSLLQGVMNTFVMFFSHIIGRAVDSALRRNDDEHSGPGIGSFIATMVAQVVLGILASIVVNWFSRFREYRADTAGANLAGRYSMIAALQRLQAEQGQPVEMPAEMTAFGMRGNGIASLFATHPPLEDRIRALQNQG